MGLEEGIGQPYRREFRAEAQLPQIYGLLCLVPISLSHHGPLASPVVPSSHIMEAAAVCLSICLAPAQLKSSQTLPPAFAGTENYRVLRPPTQPPQGPSQPVCAQSLVYRGRLGYYSPLKMRKQAWRKQRRT